MVSFLERYQAGDHVAVWEELCQLDDTLYQEPLYTDAMAVAREIVRRARSAMVRLQRRLRATGYHFGLTHLAPKTCFWLEDTQEPPPPYRAAHAHAPAKLAAIEATRGRWPLSLHAWFEQMDCVNFVGAFAGLATTPQEMASVAAAPAPALGLPSDVVRRFHEQPESIDPFWCWPLPSLHDLRDHPPPPRLQPVSLCPDAGVKGGEDGCLPYLLVTSEPGADVWLESERWRVRFVPYLRRCLLEWGGFPGLGDIAGLSPRVVASLTAGLSLF